MKKCCIYIIVCLGLQVGRAQGLASASVKVLDTIKMHPSSRIIFKKIPDGLTHKTTIPFLFKSPYQHKDELGFFCRWELKLDKQVNHAVRFRLGSYDYVNRMEGK